MLRIVVALGAPLAATSCAGYRSPSPGASSPCDGTRSPTEKHVGDGARRHDEGGGRVRRAPEPVVAELVVARELLELRELEAEVQARRERARLQLFALDRPALCEHLVPRGDRDREEIPGEVDVGPEDLRPLHVDEREDAGEQHRGLPVLARELEVQVVEADDRERIVVARVEPGPEGRAPARTSWPGPRRRARRPSSRGSAGHARCRGT